MWRMAASLALVVVLAAWAAAEPPAQSGSVACGQHKMVTPAQLTWGPAPPGLPRAVEAAVLEGDPMHAGYFSVRLRIPDGGQVKPHWHSQDEHLTVLSGTFLMGLGEKWDPAQTTALSSGGYMGLPAGEKHFAQARGEVIVQVSGMGPFDIHYVNPADDPRQRRSSR